LLDRAIDHGAISDTIVAANFEAVGVIEHFLGVADIVRDASRHTTSIILGALRVLVEYLRRFRNPGINRAA
jgi:hypothetical protein